jgi:hypothetical protein
MKRQVSTMRTFAALRLGRAPRLPISSAQYGHSGVRRWTRSSFGLVVALVAVIGFSLPMPGLAGKEDPSPTVTILVYNHTQASAAILAGAEREAGRIFGEAGLQPVWLDCLDRDAAAHLQELCHKGREPIDVALRVLPGHIQSRLQDTLFGFAFPPALASVYYEYAGRLASSDTEISIMLGCAIAHEVGHLLLGPNSHSGGGNHARRVGAHRAPLGVDGEAAFRVPTGEAHSGRGAKTNETTDRNSQRAASGNG